MSKQALSQGETRSTGALETDFLRLQGNHHAGNGELKQAMELYTKALRICLARPVPDPKELAKLYSNRSFVCYRQRNFVSAVEDADRCIDQDATWNKGYLRKGLALFAKREFDEARKCYQTGLAMCPDDAELTQALKDVERVGVSGGVRLGEGQGKQVKSGDVKPETGSMRVKWDEGNLEGHMQDKGKLYGTMVIDEVDTPFLVYDEELAERHNLIGTVEKDRSVTPIDMTVLKEKLGLLSAGKDTTVSGNRAQRASFEERRLKFYQEEAKQYVASEAEVNGERPESVGDDSSKE